MHENATIFVYDYPCPDGVLARKLANYLPLGKYTTGIIPIALTHPVSEKVKRKIYWKGNKSNRLIFVDCSLPRYDIIELASYYEQIIICDHHSESRYTGFGFPENVMLYIDSARCGSEIFFDEIVKPSCPGLKRPLLLDIVKIADLAISDPDKIASLLGQDNIDALGLYHPEDLHYMLVSCLDLGINYDEPDQALVSLDLFHDTKTLEDIVTEGKILYPELVAEAHRLLSKPCYIPIELPGLGPVFVPYVAKNIHENRFVANEAENFHPLTFIGCKRKNGIFYLSIRTRRNGQSTGFPDAETLAKFLSRTAFLIEENGKKKIEAFIDGGGRGPVACCQADPGTVHRLLPIFKEGDKRLKDPPGCHAKIRHDRIVELNGVRHQPDPVARPSVPRMALDTASLR